MADGSSIDDVYGGIVKNLSSTGDMNRLGAALGLDGRFQEQIDKKRAMDIAARTGSQPTTMRRGGPVKKMAAGGKVRGCGVASKGKTRGRVV